MTDEERSSLEDAQNLPPTKSANRVVPGSSRPSSPPEASTQQSKFTIHLEEPRAPIPFNPAERASAIAGEEDEVPAAPTRAAPGIPTASAESEVDPARDLIVSFTNFIIKAQSTDVLVAPRTTVSTCGWS